MPAQCRNRDPGRDDEQQREDERDAKERRFVAPQMASEDQRTHQHAGRDADRPGDDQPPSSGKASCANAATDA
jgi:hypothetical protein